MIKGIVFDIGGVLAFDIREYLFYEEGTGLIAKLGLDKQIVSEIDAILYEKYAYSTIGTSDDCRLIEEQYWTEVVNKLGLNISIHELINFQERYVRQVVGMMDLVKSLKQLDLLICSNNTEFWFQRINQSLQLYNFFDERKIILSNRFGAAKSDPNFTLFKELEKQMDYNKENYIFIDDRKGNIDKAIQFGLTSIYFPAEAIYGKEYVERIIKTMI